MLDQLDDPVPFTVTLELVAAAKSRGAHLRRRHRAAVTGAMVPVVLVLALVAGAIYVDRRLDQVQRVEVAAGVLAPVAAGEPFNVLVVGTDGPRPDDETAASPDGAQPDSASVPTVPGERSDTIMVVHVDQSSQHIDVLSLPRDLVFDDGTATTDRINTFLPRGGPDALISAIHHHLGIDIAHYVEIDLVGFTKLIDAAGGISVQSSALLRDMNTGLDLDATCRHLDVEQALQLARSRHVEYQIPDGRWRIEPTSDLGRMSRQQSMLQLVFQQLTAMPSDPKSLSTLIDVFAENTTVDAGFDRNTMLDLATWGHSLVLPNIAILATTLPVEPYTQPNGAEVLRQTADAAEVVSAFKGSPSTNGGGEQPPSRQSAGDLGRVDDQRLLIAARASCHAGQHDC